MNFALPFALAVLVALYTWWHYRRINAMIAAWAQPHGYKLLEVHRWYLTFPPLGMLLTTSREQSIVHIKVLDPATQRIREGFLRVGSATGGARWISTPPKSAGRANDRASRVGWADKPSEDLSVQRSGSKLPGFAAQPTFSSISQRRAG